MITKLKLKNLSYCLTPNAILLQYKQAVQQLIMSCKADMSLFDFNSMVVQGTSIMQGLREYATQSISAMIEQSNSDFVLHGDTKSMETLGILNGLGVIYYPDEKDSSLINKALCTVNLNVFSSLVKMGAIEGVASGVDDRKVNTTISRLAIPSKKTINSTKANVYKDILFGNKNGVKVYTGPLIKFDSVDDNQNMMLSYTNCNGIPIQSALFVPLAFLFVIEEVFNAIFTTDSSKGVCQAAIASSIVDPRSILNDLSKGVSTVGNWGKRPIERKRSITLWSNVVKKVYGNRPEVQDKIDRVRPQLGLTFPQLRYTFYDLRGAYDSYEPQRIDPLTFRSLSPYLKSDLNEDIKVIKSTSQFPKFILVSLYRESVDKLMTERIDAPDLWKSLNIPDRVLNDKFSDEHKRLVYGAFKYSSSDLYMLMTNPANRLVFGNVDERAKRRLDLCGLSSYKVKKVALPDNYVERLDVVKKALSKGICYVDYSNKKGGVNRHTLTSNYGIITQIYGDDYIAKYGSLKKRIDEMSYAIEICKTTDELYHYIQKTGIMDLAEKEITDKRGKVLGVNPPFPPLSSDLEKFKQDLIVYLDSLVGLSTVQRQQPTDVPPEKQKVMGVSLAATPRYSTASIEGSSDFFTYLEIGGITNLGIFVTDK